MFIQQSKQPLLFQLMYLLKEEIWSKMLYFFLNYTENYNVVSYWSNFRNVLSHKMEWVTLSLIFVTREPAKNISKLYIPFPWKGFKYCIYLSILRI